MIKKNILPVFLLALVVLLSVFYVKQESSDITTGTNNNDLNSEEVSSDFSSKRLEILEERSTLVDELEESIASGKLDNDEITQVMEKINELYYLKYTEVELEDAIILLGYNDCLVVISEYDVEVLVSSNDLTSGEFIKITNLIKEKLSDNYKVSVETVSEEN